MKRSFVRALLASAAVAAAVTLAGCNPSDVPTSGRHLAPLSQKMLSDIQEKNMDKESPILVRLFKEESELEVWKQTKDGQFALLKSYPICRWSGDLGPKKKEGDRQAPEGFYTITPGQMNPNSSYYLAFNTGFPNAYDRAMGYTGSELMVHGDCSSRGCYAMTDEQIQEIYALARESFFGGQKSFQMQAFPFRMTALNMAKHRNSPHFAFWKMLKEGYDHFEATKVETKVAVCERRYVYDAAAPDGATRPLAFNPKGACPAYQLDKNVAEAVLDHRRQEQFKMAQHIAEGVQTVAFRTGTDGGMNPVFAAKLGTQEAYDIKGNLIQVATAPGSLPRDSGNIPQTTITVPKAAPTQVASAPETSTSAPSQQPTSIGGLIGNIFSGTQQTKTASAEEAAPALRGTNTDMAAKPKRATPAYQTASTPRAKPQEAAAPKTVANAERTRAGTHRVLVHARASSSAVGRSAPRGPAGGASRHFREPLGGHSDNGFPLTISTTTSMTDAYVYVLGTFGNGRHLTYVGWTNNIEKRLAQHNAGKGARSTRGRVWVLLHSERFDTRQEAMSREWHLKRDRAFRKSLAMAFHKLV